MELNYETIKALVLEHPDKSKLIRVIKTIDESTSPAITRPIINKHVRMSPPNLERILYFLTGIRVLAAQSVGRMQAYAVTSLYGGRLIDELNDEGTEDNA